MQKFVLLSLFIGLLSFSSTSEMLSQQRFRAGVVVGLNASQVLGDNVGGYNRLGIQGGLRAIAVLTQKTDLSFEILYSQRGSYGKGGSFICFNPPLDISTNYVEVPVLFSIKDWLEEEDNYYRIQVSGGFSYSRLLNASAEGSCHDSEADFFNENDVAFTIGAEYFTSPHWSFGMRWSRSINLLYDKDKNDQSLNSLRGFFLSFRSAYIF